MIRFITVFLVLFANPAFSATYIFSFKSSDLVATGECDCLERNVPVNAALVLDLDSLANVDFSLTIYNSYGAPGVAGDPRFVDARFTNLLLSTQVNSPPLHWDVTLFSKFAIKTDALGNLIHASFSSHFDTPDLRITNNDVNWGGASTEYFRGTGTWTVVAAIPLPPALPLLGSAIVLGFAALRLSAHRRRSAA